MKIRSITYFCNPGYPLNQETLRSGAEFLRGARKAIEGAGYEVQTTRLVTTPFPALLREAELGRLPEVAHEVDQLIDELGIGYASLGPADPKVPASFQVIPEAIAATKKVFFGGRMTARDSVDLQAIRACADVIAKCAGVEPNGFANLRFAALANVPSGSPFFPAAYHAGRGPAFALATEAADLAVQAFMAAGTVEEGRRYLVTAIEKHAAALTKVSRSMVRRSVSTGSRRATPKYLGIDFSLAPFPREAQSIGTAFERLGVPRIGLHGSLAAAAILTEVIDRARFARAGFSGLLLPVLEDATLAKRAAEGTLTAKDVLLYSAVCGTGLDTLPLPGSATPAQLAAVLLDLAVLAIRLDKPLTARLMPVPNKEAGEATGFDFDFFANSRVMKLDAEGLGGALSADQRFTLKPR